jgi:hypothetical protein
MSLKTKDSIMDSKEDLYELTMNGNIISKKSRKKFKKNYLNGLESEINIQNKEITNLKNLIILYKCDNELLKKQLDGMTIDSKSRGEDINRKRSELNIKLEEEYEAKYKISKETQKESNIQLENEIISLKQENTKLKIDHQNLKIQLKNLEIINSNLETDNVKNRKETSAQNELKTKISELEAINSKLLEKINFSSDQVDLLKSLNSKLEAEIKSLKNEKQSLENEKDKIIDLLEIDYQYLKEEYSKAESNLNESNEKNKKEISAQNELKTKLSELEAINSKLLEKINFSSDQVVLLKSLNSKLEAEIKSLKNEKQSLENDKDLFGQNGLNIKVTELESVNFELSARYELLNNTKFESQKSDLIAVKHELETGDKVIEYLEIDCLNLKDLNIKAQSKISELEELNLELLEKIKNESDQVEALKILNTKLETDIDTLKLKIPLFESENLDILDKISYLEKQFDKELLSQLEQNHELETSYSELEAENNKLHDEKTKEIMFLKKANLELSKNLSTIEQHYSSLLEISNIKLNQLEKINSEFSKKIHFDLCQRMSNLEQKFGKDSLDYNSQIESLKILNIKLEDENRRLKNENKKFQGDYHKLMEKNNKETDSIIKATTTRIIKRPCYTKINELEKTNFELLRNISNLEEKSIKENLILTELRVKIADFEAINSDLKEKIESLNSLNDELEIEYLSLKNKKESEFEFEAKIIELESINLNLLEKINTEFSLRVSNLEDLFSNETQLNNSIQSLEDNKKELEILRSRIVPLEFTNSEILKKNSFLENELIKLVLEQADLKAFNMKLSAENNSLIESNFNLLEKTKARLNELENVNSELSQKISFEISQRVSDLEEQFEKEKLDQLNQIQLLKAENIRLLEYNKKDFELVEEIKEGNLEISQIIDELEHQYALILGAAKDKILKLERTISELLESVNLKINYLKTVNLEITQKLTSLANSYSNESIIQNNLVDSLKALVKKLETEVHENTLIIKVFENLITSQNQLIVKLENEVKNAHYDYETRV